MSSAADNHTAHKHKHKHDAAAGRRSGRSRRSRMRTPIRRIEEIVRRTFEIVDHFAHYSVAALLAVIAVVTLGETISTLAMTHATFSAAATAAVSDVVFVTIVLGIARTVATRFEGKQVQAVLTMGIVECLREVLVIGMRLAAGPSVHSMLTELGVYTAVVVGLAAALALVRRSGVTSSSSA